MNVVLSGISKGLGLIIADVLLKKGDTVYGLSRTKTSELSDLLDQYPQTLHWLSCDLSDGEKIKQEIFRDWIGLETPIHGCVNNAAMAYDDLVSNLDLKLLENMFRVNLFTPMILTKYVIRQMLLHNITISCKKSKQRSSGLQ